MHTFRFYVLSLRTGAVTSPAQRIAMPSVLGQNNKLALGALLLLLAGAYAYSARRAPPPPPPSGASAPKEREDLESELLRSFEAFERAGRVRETTRGDGLKLHVRVFEEEEDDVVVAYLFGVLGFFMRRYNWPRVPLVIGLVLGSLFELNLHLTLRLHELGRISFAQRPLTLVLAALTVISLLLPLVRRAPATRREAP